MSNSDSSAHAQPRPFRNVVERKRPSVLTRIHLFAPDASARMTGPERDTGHLSSHADSPRSPYIARATVARCLLVSAAAPAKMFSPTYKAKQVAYSRAIPVPTSTTQIFCDAKGWFQKSRTYRITNSTSTLYNILVLQSSQAQQYSGIKMRETLVNQFMFLLVINYTTRCPKTFMKSFLVPQYRQVSNCVVGTVATIWSAHHWLSLLRVPWLASSKR